MKKILCFILLFVLFLTPALAYADDPSEDTSPGSSAMPGELEYDFRHTAENLYLVLSDNGTRATPHDVNDVYNLLVQIFYNQSNGSNEVVVIRQKLASIDTYCYTIMNNVTSINTTLSNFYNSINPDFDQTGISIYDLIHTFYDSIFDIDSTDGDISLMELLLVIEDEIENVELQLTSIITSVSSIDSKCSSIISTLNTLNTNIINVYSAISNQSSLLHGDLDTINSNMNANMALIISRLQTINNNFNNIDWNFISNNLIIYNSDFNTISSSATYPAGTYYFKLDGFNTTQRIYKIILPIRYPGTNYFNTQYHFDFGYLSNNNIYTSLTTPYYYYSYDDNFNSINIYAIFPQVFNVNITVKLTTDKSIYISSNSADLYYLDNTSSDYFYIYDWLINKSHYDTWKDLYASDDLIKAKQNQQATEDQIIEDFTGSGAGSISLSDAIVAKDTSSAIKSGFNTGASATKALNALDYNNPAGLYIWFTQDVANYFTLYTPNRGSSNQTFDSIIWTNSTTNVIDDIDSDYYRQLTQ